MTDRATLLVLAASTYQVPVIERAKARGYRVVTTDNVPSNPGHALADDAYDVDTTDAEGVLEIARHERIVGIIASSTDVAVPTAAFVASRLGLPGPPPEAAAVLCDKIRFRLWLVEQNLPAPECVSTAVWPGDGEWILKPARSSGSKGIFVVRSAEELAARLPEALGFSERALLERFVPGEQLTCEGLLRDGEAVLSWVTSRETAPSPYVATWGHRLPSAIGPSAEEAVVGAVSDVMRRLGVRDGPFDADVVWDGRHAWVLEASPRLGGNSLSRLIQLASGIDLVDEAVACAVGETFGRSRPNALRPSAVVLLGVDRGGSLRYDEAALKALRSEPWVASIAVDCRPGDRVEAFINGRHRVGEALIVANDAAELISRRDEVRSRLGLSSVGGAMLDIRVDAAAEPGSERPRAEADRPTD